MRWHPTVRLIAVFAMTWVTAQHVTAAALTPSATLEVTVTTSVLTEPDHAYIRFGIAAISGTSREARTQLRPQAEHLVQLLKISGVGERALDIGQSITDEVVREEWIENEDLIEGAIVGTRARMSGTISLSDMKLAQVVVDVLASQGIDVAFTVEYSLSPAAQELATQRARSDAVQQARETAVAIAKQQGWRIAEMLPTRRPATGGGAADLGGSGLKAPNGAIRQFYHRPPLRPSMIW